MKNYSNFIESNPSILLGKPVPKGTRIPIELILRKLSQGATIENLFEMYPTFSLIQYQAILEYAADLITNEEVLEIQL